jgi:hypothetical protein
MNFGTRQIAHCCLLIDTLQKRHAYTLDQTWRHFRILALGHRLDHHLLSLLKPAGGAEKGGFERVLQGCDDVLGSRVTSFY